MNIEVYSLLQNSEFVIQYSIFVFRILCLFGRDALRPYNCALRFAPCALRHNSHGHGPRPSAYVSRWRDSKRYSFNVQWQIKPRSKDDRQNEQRNLIT